jgi:hypothetical protein
MPPVAGLFEITTCLPLLGVFVPVKGPVAITTMFSGEKGSVPAGSSSYKIFAPSPLPPKNFRFVSSPISPSSKLFEVRSTLNIGNVYMFGNFNIKYNNDRMLDVNTGLGIALAGLSIAGGLLASAYLLGKKIGMLSSDVSEIRKSVVTISILVNKVIGVRLRRIAECTT